MEIVSSVEGMRRIRSGLGDRDVVGLVPTMGSLHEGHLSLLERARQETDYVVASVFVNPIQFGEGEDLDQYPRNPQRDERLARKAGVDLVFVPPVEEVYPEGFCTYVQVEGLTDCLCGSARPGHFRGVATVVTKIFNMVAPQRAYFGQKDYQQALVIRRLARDLNFDLKVIICPTVRDSDGMALSSRNAYLTDEERRAALALYRALGQGRDLVAGGTTDVDAVERKMKGVLEKEALVKIDYIEVRSALNLQRSPDMPDPALLAGAIMVGKTRLIDNLVVRR